MIEEAGIRMRARSGSAIVPNKANGPSQITEGEKSLVPMQAKPVKWQSLCPRGYQDIGGNVNKSVTTNKHFSSQRYENTCCLLSTAQQVKVSLYSPVQEKQFLNSVTPTSFTVDFWRGARGFARDPYTCRYANLTEEDIRMQNYL